MKITSIAAFGDSWIYGDELLDPTLVDHPQAHPCMNENVAYRERHCFAGLLGQHYGVPVENFGIPGGSLQSTIWTFLWWLERQPNPENCLVLVGLTDSDRFSYYDPNFVSFPGNPPWNRFVHSSWIESGATEIPPAFRDLYKRHITLTDCLS